MRRGALNRTVQIAFTIAALAAVAALVAVAHRWLAPRLSALPAAVGEPPGVADSERTPGAAEEITNEERRTLDAVLQGAPK